MPIVRTLLVLALAAAPPAWAQNLGMATSDPAVAAERPSRGSTMSSVQGRFGEPTSRHATVGNPPITRWDYPQFSVYFEHDRVLHAVVVRAAPSG
ncbi:MAG: phosphodiesterase [Gammaproteobacteria bacterium]